MNFNSLREILIKENRSLEDLNRLMNISEDLNFIKYYNDKEKQLKYCKNAELKYYAADDILYSNTNTVGNEKNDNFLIIKGSANVYKREVNEDGFFVNNYLKTLIEGNEFGGVMLNELKTSEKNENVNIVIISNNNTEIAIFKEFQKNSTNLFDPSIFLIDNYEILYDIIDNVKHNIDNDFKSFNKFDDLYKKFSNEKEVQDFFSNLTSSDSINTILKRVDIEFDEYTDSSKSEIKYAVIIWKTLEDIKKCNNELNNGMDDLKKKLYNENNQKNKNLLKFDLEEELDTDEFNQYIKSKVNKDGKLNNLLEEKRKNENTINDNKIKIKCEESCLLDSFYCLKCKMKPRNIVSTSCFHLVSCEDCIKKTKVCPKCGIDIEKYDKIYR